MCTISVLIGWQPTDNYYYHSLYSILDFDWLIHLQITASKYQSAAINWCKYFIEHAHFENASSASIKNIKIEGSRAFDMKSWTRERMYVKLNYTFFKLLYTC